MNYFEKTLYYQLIWLTTVSECVAVIFSEERIQNIYFRSFIKFDKKTEACFEDNIVDGE